MVVRIAKRDNVFARKVFENGIKQAHLGGAGRVRFASSTAKKTIDDEYYRG
jgi:hypothetical protein